MNAERDYLTPEALARELGLQEQTLANWRSTSRGPSYVRIGRKVVYKRQDVDKWLDSRTIHPRTA